MTVGTEAWGAALRGACDRWIDRRQLANVSVLIAQHGHVVFRYWQGLLDVERQSPVHEDSLFRIYSMTKPITALATLILAQRSLLAIDDPVSKYLPEWQELSVRMDGEEVPARQMTVSHLLTHTAGLGYGYSGDTEIDRLYREQGLIDDWDYLCRDTDELVKGLAKMPLLYQPGSRWYYSFASDVLGEVIRRVSGVGLDRFLSAEVFEPLGVDEAYFDVPDAALDRFGTNQFIDAEGRFTVQDRPGNHCEFRDVTFLSGGGGLVMTVAGFFRIAELLRNLGSLDGRQVLGRDWLAKMTHNQLPRALTTTEFGYGFGLGIEPLSGNLEQRRSYYWGGAAGTVFWVDVVEDLVVLFFTQCMNVPPQVQQEFRSLVYEVGVR